MKITCPCCAGTGEIEESPAAAMLTPTQRKIYLAARDTKGGIEIRKLVDHLYGDRHDGGPLYAWDTIHVTVHNMNKRLAPYGEAVKSNRSGPGAVYRLHCNVE